MTVATDHKKQHGGVVLWFTPFSFITRAGEPLKETRRQQDGQEQ